MHEKVGLVWYSDHGSHSLYIISRMRSVIPKQFTILTLISQLVFMSEQLTYQSRSLATGVPN